jgi:hypothetical protein
VKYTVQLGDLLGQVVQECGPLGEPWQQSFLDVLVAFLHVTAAACDTQVSSLQLHNSAVTAAAGRRHAVATLPVSTHCCALCIAL